jgi:NTE family protein
MKLLQKLMMILILLTFSAGCTYYHYPINAPLNRYDPDFGYKPKNSTKSREAGDLLLMLTFSGGGTRAAAFSYGVLEALRDTRVIKGGRELRLLDEVDLISGVSGGSFTAAYYGLFGDRTFRDFEQKFLKKDIQGDLSSQIFFNFANWTRLFSPYFDRSDLAAEYYDKNIFEGATFADLAQQSGPMVLINATDMVCLRDPADLHPGCLRHHLFESECLSGGPGLRRLFGGPHSADADHPEKLCRKLWFYAPAVSEPIPGSEGPARPAI